MKNKPSKNKTITKKVVKPSKPVAEKPMDTTETEYKKGDEVKVTAHHIALYPKLGASFQGKKAVVTKVKSRKIKITEIGKEEKALYQQLYGIKEEYTLYELWVKIEDSIYIVSQFDFTKV